MMNCEEVARTVASEVLVESTSQRRLALRVHLFICRRCRRYAGQLSAIDAAARRRWGAGSGDPATIERLERIIRLDSGSTSVESRGESDD